MTSRLAGGLRQARAAAAPLVMTDGQRQPLEVVARSQTTAHREVVRARGDCCRVG